MARASTNDVADNAGVLDAGHAYEYVPEGDGAAAARSVAVSTGCAVRISVAGLQTGVGQAERLHRVLSDGGCERRDVAARVGCTALSRLVAAGERSIR
jgi:hypothetical protein